MELAWEPISLAGETAERQIYFDGVCRIEARVVTEHEDKFVYALLYRGDISARR